MDRYLQSGDIVRNSSASKEYCIDGLVGRGASCAVYHAHCTDMEGHYTEHLLKEFNPRGFLLHRNDTGSLCLFNEKDQDKFESELQHFKSGAKMQEDVRRTSKLKNKTSNIQSRFSANGTHYIDMTVQEGETYDKITEDSLYQLLRRIISITSVLKEYHQHGLLHLDVKPENIFIFPETDDLVQMFDFDSVVKKDDLPFGCMLSYTTDWAAQEQVLGYLRKDICEATDLFAVGEILFYKLMGRHSYPHERRSFSKIEFDRAAPIFKDVNPKLFPLLSEIFRHTICNTVSMRYPSADALLKALEKALSLAMPNKPFLASHLPGQASFFIGRDRQLQAIHQMLQEHDVLFVSGIGGIGKSELAKQYAYLHAAEYDAVLFAMCTTDLKSMLLDDTQIPIAHFHREEEEKSEAYYSRKMGKLRELCDSRILIIIDNVNDLQDPVLSELLKLNCKLLITTRADAGAWSYPQLIISKLESESDIRCLLDHWYPHAEDSPEAEEAITAILDFYNGHTLAVELIAKQMQAGRVTPQKMWQKLTSAGLAGAGKERVASRKDDTAKQQSAYGHIRDLFRISALTEEQIYVLVNLSLIPPSGISAELFQQWCNLESFDTINELISAGWVREDPQTWTISLHPLIADVMQEQLAEDCCSCEELLYTLLDYYDGNISCEERFWIASIAPCIGERLCRLPEIPDFVGGFIHKMSIRCYRFGSIQTYTSFLNKAISLNTKADNQYIQAALYSTLGAIYTYTGNYQSAEECYNISINLNLDLYGENHEAVAGDYFGLAELLTQMGRSSESAALLGKVINISNRLRGNSRPDQYTENMISATRYCNLSQWDLAKNCYQKALDALSQHQIHQPFALAPIYNDLGVVCANLGELEDAQNYLTTALTIRKDIYGESHADVASSYRQLANFYSRIGKFTRAKDYLLQALTINIQVFGEFHSTVGRIYHDLGFCFHQLQLFKDAECYYKKALNILDHEQYNIQNDKGTCYFNLGILYCDFPKPKFQQAESAFCKYLECCIHLHGGESEETAHAYYNLALTQQDLNKLSDAEFNMRRALEIRTKLFGETDEDTLQAKQDLEDIRSAMA